MRMSSIIDEREQKVVDDLQNYVGKPCTICADLCPYPEKDKAIAMVSDNKGNHQLLFALSHLLSNSYAYVAKDEFKFSV